MTTTLQPLGYVRHGYEAAERTFCSGVGWSIVQYHDDLAEGVAAMLRASSPAWPGGLRGADTITAEGVRRQQQQGCRLATLIAIVDDEVAGMCNLEWLSKQENTAWIGFLNVAPRFQGRKLGREMLRTCVALTTEEGYLRLGLATWAGNLKALPLYKKSGFFWRPGTRVFMENYLPSLLRLPLLSRFLDGRDWYDHLERELRQEEDDLTEGGVHVYPYAFTVNGETLRVLVDRERWGICGYDHPRFSIVPRLERQDVPTGVPGSLAWRLRNRDERPLQVALVAGGDGGVTSLLAETMELTGERVVEQAFTVTEGCRRRHPDDEPAIGISGHLLLDMQLLPIAVGLRPKPVFSVSLAPAHVGLVPAVERRVAINVANNNPHPLTVQVELVPDEGLELWPASHRLELPANGSGGLVVSARAAAPGLHAVTARVGDAGNEALKTQAVLHLPCLGPGGLAGYATEDECVLESASTRVVLARRGGSVTLRDRLSDIQLLESLDFPGPPFWPRSLARGDYAWQVRQEPDALLAWADVHSDNLPDLALTQEVRLLADGSVSRRVLARNLGQEPVAAKLMYWGRTPDVRGLALPLHQGLVHERGPDFRQSGEGDMTSAHFSEGWLAVETQRHYVAGLIWPGPIELPSLLNAVVDLGTIAPESLVASKPLHLVARQGRWQDVRQAWRQTLCPEAAAAPPRSTAGLTVALLPRPSLLGRRRTVAVEVANLDTLPVQGTLRLQPPDGWRAEPCSWEVSVPGGSRFYAAVALSAPDGAPSAGECRLRLDTEVQRHTFRQCLYVAEGAGAVSLSRGEEHGREVLYLDNGLLRAVAAPSYGGSLVSLRHAGTEQLHTSFPTPRALLWQSEWLGGVRPAAYLQPPDRTAQETFTWQPIERQAWQGLRLSAPLPRAPGLALHCDYLTLPGSNILAWRATLANEGGAAVQPSLALECYLRPDAAGPLTAHYRRDGRQWLQRQGGKMARVEAGQWCAVERPGGECAALVVAGEAGELLATTLVEDGIMVAARRPGLTLGGGESGGIAGYLVFAPDLAAAERYRGLGAGAAP